MGLGEEKFMRFTTFKRDGTPVTTPVWVVDLGEGRVGFWTSSGSGKAKRLAHTSRVLVQPSNGRGVAKAGTEPVQASATVVSGAELDRIGQLVTAKYGIMTKISKVLNTLGGRLRGRPIPYGDCGVV